MGNRQTTNTSQSGQTTNTYGWETPPDTADISAARSHKFGIDPTIPYRVGAASRRNRDSFQNPAGGYTTPQMRDAIMRGQERENMQTGGEQTREGYYDVGNQQFGQKMGLAGLTAPRLVQKGSSGQTEGKSTTSEPWYNGMVQGGASMGSALIM